MGGNCAQWEDTIQWEETKLGDQQCAYLAGDGCSKLMS